MIQFNLFRKYKKDLLIEIFQKINSYIFCFILIISKYNCKKKKISLICKNNQNSKISNKSKIKNFYFENKISNLWAFK